VGDIKNNKDENEQSPIFTWDYFIYIIPVLILMFILGYYGNSVTLDKWYNRYNLYIELSATMIGLLAVFIVFYSAWRIEIKQNIEDKIKERKNKIITDGLEFFNVLINFRIEKKLKWYQKIFRKNLISKCDKTNVFINMVKEEGKFKTSIQMIKTTIIQFFLIIIISFLLINISPSSTYERIDTVDGDYIVVEMINDNFDLGVMSAVDGFFMLSIFNVVIFLFNFVSGMKDNLDIKKDIAHWIEKSYPEIKNPDYIIDAEWEEGSY